MQYDIVQLNEMLVPELRDLAEEMQVPGFKKLAKKELVYKILDQQALLGTKSEKVTAPPVIQISNPKPEQISLEFDKVDDLPVSKEVNDPQVNQEADLPEEQIKETPRELTRVRRSTSAPEPNVSAETNRREFPSVRRVSSPRDPQPEEGSNPGERRDFSRSRRNPENIPTDNIPTENKSVEFESDARKNVPSQDMWDKPGAAEIAPIPENIDA